MEEVEGNVSLNSSNLLAWKTLCTSLKLTDDGLFKILLNAYKSFCNNSVLQNTSNGVMQQLDYQRQSDSNHCDFHYRTDNDNETTLSSAHSCVLEACFGQEFVKFFELLSQGTEAREYLQQNDFCVTRLNNKVVYKVPNSFRNIVEYCYTGNFRLKDENGPNIAELQTLIEQLVEKPEIRVGIKTDFDKCKEDNVSKSVPEMNKTQTKRKRGRPRKTDSIQSFARKKSKPPVTQKRKANTPTKVVIQKQIAENSGIADEDYIHFSTDDDISTAEDSDDWIPSENDDRISDQVVEGDSPAKEEEKVIEVASASSFANLHVDSYKCTDCKCSFSTKAELSKHFKNEHFKTLPKQSQRKTRLGKQKVYVELEAKPKKIEIPIGKCCEEEFMSTFKFGVHILRKHSVTSVNCSECEDLVLLQDLIPHYQICHDFPSFLLGQTDDAPVTVEPSNSENFEENSSNSTQQNASNTMSLLFGATSMPSENLAEPSGACSILDLNVTKSQDLPKVMDSNLWEKEVKCIGCLNEMSNRKYVDHLNEQYEHSQSDYLSCNGATLYRKYRCLYFQCLLCRNENLETGMKPIRFYLLLMGHIKNYHKPDSTKDERVPCDICNNLILKHYIQEHKKRHAYSIKRRAIKVTCDICGKAVTKNRFTTHHRSHTERFPCPHCSKVFNRKENLRVHERIHTGEKPFVCDVCGKGFRQKVELRLHGRRHEKESASASKPALVGSSVMQEATSYLTENPYYY